MMSDSRKSCLGFAALILGLVLAGLSLVAGGIGEMVILLGGETLFNFRLGLIAAIVLFSLLFLMAVYFFISIRDWSWLPAIAGGVYAVAPDIIFGPQDDLLALIGGVVVSVLLSWIDNRRDRRSADPSQRAELPPDLPED
jgi:formate hydrogenlyase subunit 3/multisubunit Na+/H+ antiporter MnhD subunit